MATGAEVLEMLLPNGGWIIVGDEYSGITFLECEAITEKEFTDGFAKFDKWKIAETKRKATDKAALLAKLGITADEAALLLS
jgi:hypothetical protein